MRRLRRLRLGKLAIYSVGVSSDLLAEAGAGAFKFVPIALRKVGFVLANVLGFVAVEHYGITLGLGLAGVAALLALAALRVRRVRRRTVSAPHAGRGSATRYASPVRCSYTHDRRVRMQVYGP